MASKQNKQLATEYIQFSKRVTRWGMILVSAILLICLAIISFLHLDIETIRVISTLYTTYVTIMGIVIGAYQGNSTLEKWSKARYNFEEAISPKKEENGEEEQG